MEVWLQNEGFHQYLIINTEQVHIDGFEMNMLMHYEGCKLLPLEQQCKNGSVNISYEISGAASIQQVFQGKEMDGKILQKLFASLWDCYEEIEAYLLPIEGVLLQPERIYYQPGKEQFRFCFIPEHNKEFYQEFLALVEFCMKRTRHQDSDAVLFIYGLYRLLQEGNTEQEELGKYITERRIEASAKKSRNSEVEKPLFNQNRERKENQLEVDAEIMNVVHGKEPEEIIKESVNAFEKQCGIYNNGNIAVYFYGGLSILSLLFGFLFGIRFFFLGHRDTDIKISIIMIILLVVFTYSMLKSKKADAVQDGGIEMKVPEKDNAIQIIAPSMLQEDTESKDISIEETSILTNDLDLEMVLWELESMQLHMPAIPLDRLPGIIGRKPEEVDYVVPGNGVSRRHVMLFQSGEELYAEDLASTNGTYINGIRLKAGEPKRLKAGDQLFIGPNQYLLRRKH